VLALPPNVVPPKALLLAGAVVVAAGALFTVRSGVFTQGESTQARSAAQARPQAATVVQTAPAERGPIRSILNYAGTITASQQVNVVPRANGIVKEILVNTGTQVKRGDVVAVLDPGALPDQLQQAVAGMDVAEAKLAQVQAGGRPEDVAAAAAQVNQARARLQGLQQGRPEDVQAAQALLDVQLARLEALEQGGRPEAIAQAQATLDGAVAKLALLQKGATPDARQAAQSAVDADKASLAAIQTSLNNLSASSTSDVQAAQSAYDAAVANLASAQAGSDQAKAPTDAQISSAEAALAKARSDSRAADSTLAGLTSGSSSGACLKDSKTGARTNQAACDVAIAAANAGVASAREGVESAQAALAQLQSGGAPASQAQTAAQLESAEATVRSTKARLDAALGNVEVQRNQLQSQVVAAQEKLKSDQAKLDQVLAGPQPEEVAQAEAAVHEAEQRLALAVSPGSEQDIRAQRAQVEQARQQLEKAQAPASTFDLQQQQEVITQMQAQYQVKANPFTAADIQAAVAGVEQAKAALALAQTNLAVTVITAPFDGVVGQRLLSVGAFAAAATPIMTLASNEVELHITAEESRVGLLLPGQSVSFTLAAYPNESFTGSVSAIAPVGDLRAHTFDVTILPDVQDKRVMAGMFAQVELIAAQKSDAVLVPRDAIVQVGGESTVFVAQDGRAVARKVQTGIVDEKTAEIVDGVNAGDVIVTLGQNNLRDGQAVQVPGQGGGRGGRGQGGSGA
jgi:RND family efflux transporter MFP subunit